MECDRQYLNALPFEILTLILKFAVEVDFCQSTIRSACLEASHCLLKITRINSRLRRIAISIPQLWTNIPFINDLHSDYLQTMLWRSFPLPFSLGFLEDESLPLSSSVWEPIMSSKERMGFLFMEVEEDFGGTIAKALLTAKAPALKGCFLKFHGHSSVVLPLDGTRYNLLFDGHAPQLQTLDLINCHIASPGFDYPNTLSSVSIRFLRNDSDHCFNILDTFHLWNGRFGSVRVLELSNCCFPSGRLPTHELELPSLHYLVLSASYPVCETLANALKFPDTATRRITVLFPATASPQDAQAAVLAVGAFLTNATSLKRVRFNLEQRNPTILLHRVSGGDVSVAFDLQGIAITTGGALRYLRRYAMNMLSAISSRTSIPLVLFSSELWKAIGVLLQHQMADGVELYIILPFNHGPSSQQYLEPILRKLPAESTIQWLEM